MTTPASGPLSVQNHINPEMGLSGSAPFSLGAARTRFLRGDYLTDAISFNELRNKTWTIGAGRVGAGMYKNVTFTVISKNLATDPDDQFVVTRANGVQLDHGAGSLDIELRFTQQLGIIYVEVEFPNAVISGISSVGGRYIRVQQFKFPNNHKTGWLDTNISQSHVLGSDASAQALWSWISNLSVNDTFLANCNFFHEWVD